MAVFQVSSRSVQHPGPPRKRTRRFPAQWYAVARVVGSGFIGGVFFTLLVQVGHNTVFILLPVMVSLTWAQPQRYNISKLLQSTPLYLLLTICLTIIYYGALTASQLLLYQGPDEPHIIIVTSTLAWAIIFDPARMYVQSLIERRFNLRDREKAIKDFTATLREEIDLNQLRERFLTVIQRTMQPYSVSFWIRTSNDEPAQSGSTEEIMVADDGPLLAYVLRHPGTLEIDRLHLDSPVLQGLKLRAAEILLPLASQGELLGLLILGTHLKGEAYTREERTLLDTLAPQVAPALHVAQMVKAQQVQVRERIEQELRTAQAIQHAFLPKDVPALPGWQITTYYQPAREVGGDFYDFLPFADGRLGIVIGDATGKGMPAALVMATVHTMLRTAVQGMSAPGDILARVNNLLYAETPSGMFVTCFYALLDPKSGRLRYANAGQDLPYRRHKDGVSELWATGMPLGMMPGTRYEEQEVIVAPGDSLLFYSDGLVEAHNSRREMFDTPRLKALLEEHAAGASLINVLLSELARFTGEGWEQEDDVTLLTLQRTPASLAMNEQQATPHLLRESTVESAPGNEQQAMEWVAEVVRPLHLPLDRLANLKTAVAEAAMNAMEHGNQYQPDKPVSLQVRASQTTLVVHIRDEGGQWPMPAAGGVASPDLEAKLAGLQSPRGWGLFLIRNLVDEVSITGDDHYHIVELIMHLETLGPICQQSIE